MKTNIPISLNVLTQLPLDHKTYSLTKLDLLDLGLNQTKAFTYYLGMIVYCALEKENYIWREYLNINESDGLILGGYTYPNGIINNNYNYSNKKFNFFLLESENNISDNISNEILTGVINGVNSTFTVLNPLIANSEKLYVNGNRQKKPDDYNITGQVINLTFSPQLNETLLIDYIKQ